MVIMEKCQEIIILGQVKKMTKELLVGKVQQGVSFHIRLKLLLKFFAELIAPFR